MKKTYFNWSTGKDSAIALHKLLQDDNYSVQKLLTSVNAHYDRVSMHGLRRSLMERQVESIGIPHTTIELPQEPSMEEYEGKMTAVIEELKSENFTTAGFGDIFLEDLKSYREKQLQTVGIETVFPIWKRETKELLHEFLDLGFKTIVVCVKASLLDASYVGRVIDKDFINDLPDNVDPCGENGEFHTFCFDGPIFSKPVDFKIGEKTYREYEHPDSDDVNEEKMGFWFCDLEEVD